VSLGGRSGEKRNQSYARTLIKLVVSSSEHGLSQHASESSPVYYPSYTIRIGDLKANICQGSRLHFKTCLAVALEAGGYLRNGKCRCRVSNRLNNNGQRISGNPTSGLLSSSQPLREPARHSARGLVSLMARTRRRASIMRLMEVVISNRGSFSPTDRGHRRDPDLGARVTDASKVPAK
jgi:hypothetical protein